MPSHPADTKFFEILIINEKSNYVTQDFILKHIDRLLTQEQFERVDTILQTVGPTWESRQLYVMLSLLTSTLAAHDKLPNRGQFYRATRQRVLKDHSEHDTNMILRGLLPEKSQIDEIKAKIDRSDKVHNMTIVDETVVAKSTVSDEIKVMKMKADQVLQNNELKLEIKFHQQEIERHKTRIFEIQSKIGE